MGSTCLPASIQNLSAGYLIFISLPLLAAVWLVRFIYVQSANPLNKIPGPWISRWTNWRLKIAVMGGRRMHYVHALHQEYGHYVRISPTEISVSDPAAFTQIHKITSGFTKSKWYEDLVMFERPTLFTMVDSKAHGTRRRLLARGFSKTYLRNHWEGIVKKKISLCVSKMIEEGQQLGATDILKWWTLMATDVATHLMFGESFGMIELGRKDEYIRALESMLQGGGIGAELPLLRRVGRYLPFEPFKTLFQGSDYLLGKAEIAVRNAHAAGGEKNLFAHIIHEAGKNERLDEVDVKLEAGALIVAGSDTTAVSLTYLVWCVLSRPELSRLLRQELDRLPSGYSERDLEGLPVLNAIVEETLRLYGAAPGGIPRQNPAGVEYLGSYVIPAGTTVTTQAYTLHRDPKIFPDPLEFDHTRWLPVSTSGLRAFPDADLAKSVFSPFGAGARACLGVHIARMELLLGAAEFFLRCPSARLASSTTPESMDMENYFLIAPKSHKCEIVL